MLGCALLRFPIAHRVSSRLEKMEFYLFVYYIIFLQLCAASTGIETQTAVGNAITKHVVGVQTYTATGMYQVSYTDASGVGGYSSLQPNGFTVVSFTSGSGTFIPLFTAPIQYLVVGGGGCGGYGDGPGDGGGGGGGYASSSFTPSSGSSYSISVGAGGVVHAAGSGSSLTGSGISVSVPGGGSGGWYLAGSKTAPGVNGGSGGGGSGRGSTQSG